MVLRSENRGLEFRQNLWLPKAYKKLSTPFDGTW
jgi:hypothetical protein